MEDAFRKVHSSRVNATAVTVDPDARIAIRVSRIRAETVACARLQAPRLDARVRHHTLA